MPDPSLPDKASNPGPNPGPNADPTAPPAAGAATGAAPAELQFRQIQQLAESLEGDPQALLDLLRRLEALHRTIQDGPFRSSLPADRNQLYRLLESMEGSGGWPYIPRLQLRTFMDLLARQEPPDEEHDLAA